MSTRYIYTFAASALFLASCATQQVATQTDKYDDVYYSKAKAVDKPVYVSRPSQSEEYREGSTNYDDAYYYDDSYSNRLDRFYSYSPWRSYNDPFWGGYNNYYGNSLAYSPYGFGGGFGFGGGLGYGIGLGLGFGSPFGYYNPYSFWGPNSFYNYYGGGYNAWGGGYYGLGGYPGFYGGGVGIVNNGNYRARPTRSGDGAGYINTGRGMGVGLSRPGFTTDRQGNTISTGRTVRSRPTTYGNGNNSGSNQPERVQRSRPTRSYDPPPRQEQPQRVERSYPSSPPPRSSGGGSYGGGNSGGGGGGGRSRPGRG